MSITYTSMRPVAADRVAWSVQRPRNISMVYISMGLSAAHTTTEPIEVPFGKLGCGLGWAQGSRR